MENERLTRKQKEAEDFKWYKEKIDRVLPESFFEFDTEHHNKKLKYKVLYDLFNGKLDEESYKKVCEPYGEKVGKLPNQVKNFDILSRKIKSILGMENRKNFEWQAIAINSEAIGRKEEEEFERLKQFVSQEILEPLYMEVEQQYAEELQGKELSEDEKAQIQKQMAEQKEAITPDKVRKYMMRDHKDPAEIMINDLLEFILKFCRSEEKFNEGAKHAAISARELYFIAEHRGKPDMWVINPLNIGTITLGVSPYIEDAEDISVDHYFTRSQLISFFGEELTDKEIDEVFDNQSVYNARGSEDFFTNKIGEYENLHKVIHRVWMGLRKIGFLTYFDEEEILQERIVDEEYEFDESLGDVAIHWEWIPEKYEGWKLADNIYARMGPVLGQFKDVNDLFSSKGPYFGAIYDNTNSDPTSIAERLLPYQFYYNVILYKVEHLMSTDKGRKVLMNINMVPDSAGIDLKKWQYLAETTPFMWYDPNEEGTAYNDVNTVAKTIDLTLASNINTYIELAEYIRIQAGAAVGITEQVEGQIAPDEAVTNSKQNLIQASYIIEPFFDLHKRVKRNVIEGLLELSKIIYSKSPEKKLSFILDDLSQKVIQLDIGLLNNNTFGIFITSQSEDETEEIKQVINNLAINAVRPSEMLPSEIIALLKENNLTKAQETLQLSEMKRSKEAQQAEEAKAIQEKEKIMMMEELAQKEHERRLNEIIVKEEERRKTEVAKAAMIAASYNPDQDKNNDGINDFVQIADKFIKEKIAEEKMQLEKEKFDHQKEIDKKDMKLKEKKLLQSK